MYFNDFITPIKTYVDDRVAFYLLKDYAKLIKIYAKLNQATLDDDYMKINSASNRQFFSFDKVLTDVGSFGNDIIAEAAIFLDPNRDHYHRTVFSIMDLFGTIGGIYGLLISVWGFIVGAISLQIMLSSVFRRLYYNTFSWLLYNIRQI